MKVPNSLQEAIIAIAELQVRAEWLQGQSNLLLGFVVASPQNLQSFANFATAIAAGTGSADQEMRAVAQRLLKDGLSVHASPQPQPPAPAGGAGAGASGSNIIQFPSRP